MWWGFLLSFTKDGTIFKFALMLGEPSKYAPVVIKN